MTITDLDFCDDKSLIKDNTNNAQELLNALFNSTAKVGLSVNAAKTQVVFSSSEETFLDTTESSILNQSWPIYSQRSPPMTIFAQNQVNDLSVDCKS